MIEKFNGHLKSCFFFVNTANNLSAGKYINHAAQGNKDIQNHTHSYLLLISGKGIEKFSAIEAYYTYSVISVTEHHDICFVIRK